MEEHSSAEGKTIVISENVEKFNSELKARYGVVPDHAVVDIEFKDNYRILWVSEPVFGKKEPKITAKRTKSNCKHCFCFGYVAALEPINPEQPGQRILQLCSCLKPVKEKDGNDRGNTKT